MSSTVETATEIRPFHVEIPEEQLDDLRRRIAATRWPTKELVPDRSQGVQLATMQELAALLGHRLRLAQGRGEAQRAPAVHDRDRRGRDPLHPREVAARERVAADHDARLARLGHRAARDRRPAHRPDRARRRRRGRVRPRAAVPARLRLLRRADRARLGRRPHRTRVGGADAPPRLHPLRRPGRRRGCPRHGPDGPPGGRGFGRLPPEPAHGGARNRRSPAQGIRTGTRSGRGGRDVQAGRLRLLPRDGNAATDDRLLPAGFTRRAGGLAARPRHGQLLQDLPRLRRRRARGQSHPGQHRRQHHAVLADRHRSRRRPGRTGRTDERWPQRLRAARLLRRSPCRSASRRSPARSGLPRAAGSRRSTPASPTSTRPTGAATSPPGRSRSSSPTRSATPSGRCERTEAPHEQHGRTAAGGR